MSFACDSVQDQTTKGNLRGDRKFCDNRISAVRVREFAFIIRRLLLVWLPPTTTLVR